MGLQEQADEDRREAQRCANKDESAVKWLSSLINGVEFLLSFLLECAIFFFPSLPSFGCRWSNTSRCVHSVFEFRKRLIGVDGVINQYRIQERDTEYDCELTYHWI